MTLVATGFKELDRKLRDFEPKVAKKAVRRASREALRPVHRAAQRNAPFETGLLEQSIKVRAIKRTRKAIGSQVTTREGFFQGETFYGAFQEFGWMTGKRGSENRRPVLGKGFLKFAAESKRRTAQFLFGKIAGRIIEEDMSRG